MPTPELDEYGNPKTTDENGNPLPGYLQNVTGSDPLTGATWGYNSGQFADQPTSDYWAQQLGGKVTPEDFQYYGRSDPSNLITFDGQQGGMNAGLIAQTAARYGSAPGSYGNWLLNRDMLTQAGVPYVDPYANGTAAQKSAVITGSFGGGTGQDNPYNRIARTDYSTGQPLYYLSDNPTKPMTVAQMDALASSSVGAAAPAPATLTADQKAAQSRIAAAPINQVKAPALPPTAQAPAKAPSTATPTTGAPPKGPTSTQAPRAASASPAPAPTAGTPSAGSRINISGLSVHPDVNGAYTGTIKINGQPQTIAVLPDGSVYNSSGQDITSTFNQSELGSLTSAFRSAANDPNYSPGGAQGQQGQQGQPDPSSGTNPYYTGGPNSYQGTNYPGSYGDQGFVPSGTSTAPNSLYQGNQSPSQNFRYGSNGQPVNSSDLYGYGVNPYLDQSGDNIDLKAANDRALAIAQGGQLGQDLTNYTDYQQGQAADFQDQAQSAYAPIAAGQGGYSDAEKSSILNDPYLRSLQLSDSQAQSNYLSPEEQTGIAANPERAISQLGQDEAGIDASANNRDSYVRGSLGANEENVNSALNAQDANVRGAITGQQSAARAYLDPSKLGLSQEYQSNYNFGPQDQQDIVNRAGRTAGFQNQANEDTLLRQAAASGNTSPLALAAARNRIQQTGGINAADAMTDARIQAKELALQTAQQKEQTRLGAEQNYAGLGTGTELNLGAAQIGAEQYLGNQRSQAQMALGQNRTGAEQTLGQSHVDIGTAGANRNLSALQTADEQASQRANTIAQNRQTTNVNNQNQQYSRGKDIYSSEAGANTNFANQRLAQEGEYRSYLAGQGTQANQAAQVGQQQRLGAYSTQTGATNAATGNAIVNYKAPSSTEKILGGIASLVGGAKGLVTPGPRMALIGEKGPELEIDLARIPHYGYGWDPSNDVGSGETDTEGHDLPGGDTVRQNRSNPLWKKIVNATTANTGYQPFLEEQADDGQQQSHFENPIGKRKSHGGLLMKMLTAGAMGEGGVVGDYPSTASYPLAAGTQREQVAPGVTYVNGPQVAPLGKKGPTAIVPLIRRPGNKLNPEDIPELSREYSNYGRRPAYA